MSGWYGLRAYEYPGYIKLGTSSKAGFLVTPKLSGLNEATDVRISFRLGNWNEPSAEGSTFTIDKAVIRVGVVPENVTDANLKSYADAYTLTTNISFTADEAPVSATPQTWTDVSFEVPAVKPTDRLIIYATVDGTEKSRQGPLRSGRHRGQVPGSVKPVTVVFEDTFDWVKHDNDWVNKQAGFAAARMVAGINDTSTGNDWRRFFLGIRKQNRNHRRTRRVHAQPQYGIGTGFRRLGDQDADGLRRR